MFFVFPFDAGVYTFNIVAVVGNPMFDYFFNMMIIFGVLSFSIGLLINLISKS
jgi:hypothetical protein